MPEEDEDWKPTERENWHDVVQRANEFLDWLAQRPETNIVVMSHGVWIECCLYAHCPEALKNGARVHNCDMIVGDCLSADGKFQSLQNVQRIK